MGSVVANRGKQGGQPARAARRAAQARTALAAAPRPVPDHIRELQEQLERRAGELDVLEEIIAGIEPGDFWRETMVGRIPNEWVRLRNEYRLQLENLLDKCIKNGIAERSVQIEGAKTVLMAGMVREAARRAGLSSAQVKALGGALRELAQEGEGAA